MKKITLQSKVRFTFLTLVGVNLVLICIQLFRYPHLLAIPGSLPYIIEPVVLLLLYGIVIFLITKRTDQIRSTVLRIGVSFGVLCGVLEIVHLVQETFFDFGKVINGILALAFMAGVFLLWGIASYRLTHMTHSVRQGILASVWSAMVTILIAVFFGFILEFYLHVPASSYVATWGEFIRSGWKDIPAFTIANTLDSASIHLLMGTIVALLFGAIGAAIEKLFEQRK